MVVVVTRTVAEEGGVEEVEEEEEEEEQVEKELEAGRELTRNGEPRERLGFVRWGNNKLGVDGGGGGAGEEVVSFVSGHNASSSSTSSSHSGLKGFRGIEVRNGKFRWKESRRKKKVANDNTA